MGWAWTEYHKSRHTRQEAIGNAVLGALISWEMDMTEGPQREGQGAVPPLCPLAMGLEQVALSAPRSPHLNHVPTGIREPLDKEKSLAWCAGWQAGKVVV